MRSALVDGSRPEVGSSRKNTRGSVSSSAAMLARLRCPPLNAPTRTSACSVRPTVAMAARTASSTSAAVVDDGQPEPGRVAERVLQRQLGVDGVVLGDVADHAAELPKVGVHVDAVEAHRPSGGRGHAGDRLQQCRLAGTAGTDDGDELTWRDRERDGVEERDLASPAFLDRPGNGLHLDREAMAQATASTGVVFLPFSAPTSPSSGAWSCAVIVASLDSTIGRTCMQSTTDRAILSTCRANESRVPTENAPARRSSAQAVSLATLDGLEGLSIGNLAHALDMSKSGIYAHFGSKQDLQLATVDEAGRIFQSEVIEPALGAPPGLGQLVAVCDAFFDYLARRTFPGGCFFAGAVLEMGTRPGPVKEQIAAFQDGFTGLIRQFAVTALEQHELPDDENPDALTFELSGIILAANTNFVLRQDPAALDMAKQIVRRRLRITTTTTTPNPTNGATSAPQPARDTGLTPTGPTTHNDHG